MTAFMNNNKNLKSLKDSLAAFNCCEFVFFIFSFCLLSSADVGSKERSITQFDNSFDCVIQLVYFSDECFLFLLISRLYLPVFSQWRSSHSWISCTMSWTPVNVEVKRKYLAFVSVFLIWNSRWQKRGKRRTSSTEQTRRATRRRPHWQIRWTPPSQSSRSLCLSVSSFCVMEFTWWLLPDTTDRNFK